jgi:S-adenosylmethionine-diacylglycerol 3-amino-3-carboxypropyl transferase
MRRGGSGQIDLDTLIFTCSWEDPESDRAALAIAPGDRVMTITSGGCNTLGLLLQDPEYIDAVDINPTQSYLLELKIAAMSQLSYPEFLEFVGLRPAADRRERYRALRQRLSASAAAFWDRNAALVEKGFLLNGRYERFVRLVGALVRLVMGRRRVRNLFVERAAAEQMEHYDRHWEIRRTRLLFDLCFNKRVLARRGLQADYFHFDDGSVSFAESFFRKFRRVAREIPIAGNYFLHLYLNGRYRSLREAPDYLREEHFATIRCRLDRIRVVTSDAKRWLAEQAPESIDCFALSNICELMSVGDTLVTFEQVARTARKGARMCFRNLMIPRTVPEVLATTITRDPELSARLLKRDRSFVYSRVDALRLAK